MNRVGRHIQCYNTVQWLRVGELTVISSLSEHPLKTKISGFDTEAKWSPHKHIRWHSSCLFSSRVAIQHETQYLDNIDPTKFCGIEVWRFFRITSQPTGITFANRDRSPSKNPPSGAMQRDILQRLDYATFHLEIESQLIYLQQFFRFDSFGSFQCIRVRQTEIMRYLFGPVVAVVQLLVLTQPCMLTSPRTF